MGLNLQNEWQVISERLFLSIEINKSITLLDKSIITVDILLHNFGAKKGMIIVSDCTKRVIT